MVLDWFVDWLIGVLVDWSIGHLVYWWIGRLLVWFPGGSIDGYFVCWLMVLHWLIGRLVD